MEDADALTRIVGILRALEVDAQRRVLASVSTFLGFSGAHASPSALPPEQHRSVLPGSTTSFSQDRTMSAKEFLRDKQPGTDIERVACLAFYLTHYRDTPHFKTVDISSLNIEAAQPKFSNAAMAVDNARARGFLVASTKGNKQLSAVGERYVELLPDRDAARSSMSTVKTKRSVRKSK